MKKKKESHHFNREVGHGGVALIERWSLYREG